MIRKCLVIGLAFVSYVSAQTAVEPSHNSPELKSYVYIHPVSLAITAALPIIPLTVYVTIENPVGTGSAFVI